MSAETLVRPLAGPRPGALVAPHHDPRPCVTNPIGWWDTGHRQNPQAIDLCNTRCPLKQRSECKPGRYEKPLGVIRASVAYNGRGTPLKQCPVCRRPMADYFRNSTPRCGHCSRKASQNPADHHKVIATLVAAKKPWSHIGAHLSINPDAARCYWVEHIAKLRAAEQGRTLVRLPGVTDDTRAKPANHADLVIKMLTDQDGAYTTEEVAWVIGSTPDAVKSFWLRERKKRIAAGEDMPGRQFVCNASRMTARPKRVAA